MRYYGYRFPMATFLLTTYFLIFAGYLLAGSFVVFHILRYSLNKSLGVSAALIFLLISIILIANNALLFFSIPWNNLFASVLH